jgi:bifunctional DNA-binding transcriptional regulator/antitoxin component of YhaV-PrlF toxin-antitoxin module
MVTKMTVKNQVTIPKRILERAGLLGIKKDERYFDVGVKDDVIVLKPVIVTVEERIPEKQWQKFEKWATGTAKGDKVFNSAEDATRFLKRSIKKR